MHLVIDANVVSGYFKEAVLEIDSGLTASVMPIFEHVESHGQVYVDEGGQIESEWREPVQREWFDPWFARLLLEDRIRQVSVANCHELRRRLGALGFPVQGREGRDMWYVRTAKAVVQLHHQQLAPDALGCHIVSEDLHLHEPGEAGRATGDNRLLILRRGEGRIVSFLARNERIAVVCVENCVSYIANL